MSLMVSPLAHEEEGTYLLWKAPKHQLSLC